MISDRARLGRGRGLGECDLLGVLWRGHVFMRRLYLQGHCKPPVSHHAKDQHPLAAARADPSPNYTALPKIVARSPPGAVCRPSYTARSVGRSPCRPRLHQSHSAVSKNLRSYNYVSAIVFPCNYPSPTVRNSTSLVSPTLSLDRIRFCQRHFSGTPPTCSLPLHSSALHQPPT